MSNLELWLEEYSGSEYQARTTFVGWLGENYLLDLDTDELENLFNSTYKGWYEYPEDYAKEVADPALSSLPESLQIYVNYRKLLKDLEYNGLYVSAGHIFED